MAQNKGFSVDFNGFLDLAESISEIDNDTLLAATVTALEKSKEAVNIEVGKAMKASKYSFKKGEKYSQGRARKSLIDVAETPIEISGTEVTAYAGFNLETAPEVLPLAYGTPHLAKDKKLYNAIKVKGSVKKEVARLQEAIFTTALKEALDSD